MPLLQPAEVPLPFLTSLSSIPLSIFFLPKEF